MKNEGDTERVDKMVVLWLALQQAIVEVGRKSPVKCPVAPWNCEDRQVRELWEKITRPDNLTVLERWPRMVGDSRSQDWALRALGICRQRHCENSAEKL